MEIIKPMEPVRSDMFESSDFLYQVKWDGVRMLAYIDKNQVELINKNLNSRTMQYPELQCLKDCITGHRAILDGEIIVLKDGKPSFHRVMRRDQCTTSQTINHLKELLPVNYMVFDILQLDQQQLASRPFLERNSILSEALDYGNPFLHLVESFQQGMSLYEAVKAQQLEGVVAKKIQSFYREGKKHRDWFKIKYRRELICVIGGYTLNNGRINALLLGVYNKQELIYIGKAGSGLTEDDKDYLQQELGKIKSNLSPFSSRNRLDIKGAVYTHPLLTVKIEYAEWTEDMHLRAPAIKGFPEISPADCTI